ncbi:hypothetical protein HYC85_022696 [Camellia sinensis]|uniref:Uncharacterized protein n=1 Tax=Camellia sinensis TaxID=4442 RepID=A0A7J7GD04_CAMSI|nr:hypothetical protein HYC85_022696 [Camellia sinensis]
MTLLQNLTVLFSDTWPVNDNLPNTLLTLTIVVLAISWYTWMFTNRDRRFPTPPGSKGLPLIGNLLSLDLELHTHFTSLSQIYGPILTLRLGTKFCVVVTSPAVAREVLKDHDTIFANRDVPAVSTVMTYGGKDIVFTPYGPEWRMLRKVCVRDMLGTATLDAVYSLCRREIKNMVAHLYNRVGSPVNVGEQMFITVLNYVVGRDGGGGGREGGDWGQFRQVVADVTEQLGKPNVSDFFPGLAWFDLQGINKKMKEASLKLEGIFGVIIDQREKMDRLGRSKGDESKDFSQVLLKLKDDGDAKTPLTMTHVVTMVVGGTDTTSNTVEFSMAKMLNKPEVIRKAQQELDTVIGKTNTLEEPDIHKLPYLNVVFKEVLRLHPVLPLMVPHCPSELCIIRGYTIPKGARVFVNVWPIHRDPSIWKNPSDFDPGRFLNGEGDYSGNDFNYFPFGSGRRICAGNSNG